MDLQGAAWKVEVQSLEGARRGRRARNRLANPRNRAGADMASGHVRISNFTRTASIVARAGCSSGLNVNIIHDIIVGTTLQAIATAASIPLTRGGTQDRQSRQALGHLIKTSQINPPSGPYLLHASAPLQRPRLSSRSRYHRSAQRQRYFERWSPGGGKPLTRLHLSSGRLLEDGRNITADRGCTGIHSAAGSSPTR